MFLSCFFEYKVHVVCTEMVDFGGRIGFAKWTKTFVDDILLFNALYCSNSTYLDISLNQSKCCYIPYKCQGHFVFQNEDGMTSTDEANYLGTSITQTINPKHEIRKRISATMVVLKKFDIFWLKNQSSKRWKLFDYNAFITSKVLYGLETLELTEWPLVYSILFNLKISKNFSATYYLYRSPEYQ